MQKVLDRIHLSYIMFENRHFHLPESQNGKRRQHVAGWLDTVFCRNALHACISRQRYAKSAAFRATMSIQKRQTWAARGRPAEVPGHLQAR